MFFKMILSGCLGSTANYNEKKKCSIDGEREVGVFSVGNSVLFGGVDILFRAFFSLSVVREA